MPGIQSVFKTLHPLHANHGVLQRVVERMAEMQRPGHVRRRDDDRVRFTIRVRLGMEVTTFLPRLIDAGLGFLVVETIGE